MSQDKVLDIIKGAILLEKRGKSFYESVAKHSESEAVKEIFTMMANEESLHIEILEKQYESYKNKGSMQSMNLGEEPETISINVLSKKIQQEISAAGYEAAAIAAAISMEDKAVIYYAERADSAEDPMEKKMYHWLSNWEKSHLQYLSNIDKELRESVWYDNKFWPLA